MACPKCKCRLSYPYYEDDMDPETDLERCAACGYIFYFEDQLEDEDEWLEAGEADNYGEPTEQS